jgi:hypothetical protein
MMIISHVALVGELEERLKEGGGVGLVTLPITVELF